MGDDSSSNNTANLPTIFSGAQPWTNGLIRTYLEACPLSAALQFLKNE
jgi:hypothetical protein